MVLTYSDIPTLPDLPFDSNIFDIWTFTDKAMNVSDMFRAFLIHCPTWVVAFFVLSFAFLLLGLVVHFIKEFV